MTRVNRKNKNTEKSILPDGYMFVDDVVDDVEKKVPASKVYQEIPDNEDYYEDREWRDNNGNLIAVWDDCVNAWMNPFPRRENFDDEEAYIQDMELHEAMRRLIEEERRELELGTYVN